MTVSQRLREAARPIWDGPPAYLQRFAGGSGGPEIGHGQGQDGQHDQPPQRTGRPEQAENAPGKDIEAVGPEEDYRRPHVRNPSPPPPGRR